MATAKGQFGFFNLENQLDKIDQINDFLLKLNALVDGEIFRNQLAQVRKKERKSNARRPAFDVILMFKILVLKSMYNLSDDQTERQIRNRISFRDFLDLERKLFERFGEELEKQGFAAKGDYIVDASF